MGTGAGISGGGGMSGDWLERQRVGRRPLYGRLGFFLFVFSFRLRSSSHSRARSLSSSTLRNRKPSRFRSALAVLDPPFPFPLGSFLELSELLLLRVALGLPQPFPLVLQMSNRIGSSVSLGLDPSPIRASSDPQHLPTVNHLDLQWP